MVQFADSERRALLGYETVPSLDRNLVSRYALGEVGLAGAVLEPFRVERFESIWSDLVALARPALAVEVRPGKSGRRSRLGGVPDLPSEADWPRRGSKPLSFVAQLDLGEVHGYLRDTPLPSTGLLSFFYEADLWTSGDSPTDRGAWRVLFSSGAVSTFSPPPVSPVTPEGYDPERWGFEEAAVAFVSRISLPESEHILIERLGIGDADYEAYAALMDELRKAHGLAGITQLLGYPAEIQHDPFMTTQLASSGVDTLALSDWNSAPIRELLNARGSWQLLLQVDSIDEIGMLWADSGLLYYCMRQEVLRAGEWDNSWLVMESL